MPTILAKLWEAIVNANATIYDFLLLLNEFSVRFFESEFAKGLFGQNAGFGDVADKYPLLPYFLMLIALIEALFGRRFLAAQKLIFGLIVGFAIGTVYIAPAVSNIIEIDHFIIGLALGIVIAVFKTPLYFATIISVLLYLFYYFSMNLLHFSAFWALAVAAVAVVLVLIFLLRWVELIATSLIGGWIFASALGLAVNYPENYKTLIFRIILFTVSVLGFVFQLKFGKRKRKKRDEEKDGTKKDSEKDKKDPEKDKKDPEKNKKDPEKDKKARSK